jgi:hypothetical protein
MWCEIKCDVIGNNLVNIMGNFIGACWEPYGIHGTIKIWKIITHLLLLCMTIFSMLLLAIKVCCYVMLLHIRIFVDVFYFALSCEQIFFGVKVQQIFILTMMLWLPQKNLHGKIVNFINLKKYAKTNCSCYHLVDEKCLKMGWIWIY